MSKVIHFEIHATDPERAIRFYTEALGWRFTKWDGPIEYWTIRAGEDGEPGVNGGLIRRMGAAPSEHAAVNAFVCTIGTDSLDSTLERIEKAGGIIAVPKMPIPTVGLLAYFKDTEGNVFGVLQPEREEC
ncbi:MAG: VOC family protein [Candidatus Omnitrophica bacterium]|nr:VOC family protein [Candidatus Omnitrophota bacterium]